MSRTDGEDRPGGKHERDEYFVLNLSTDPSAIVALRAYADAARSAGFYPLANDLEQLIEKSARAQRENHAARR